VDVVVAAATLRAPRAGEDRSRPFIVRIHDLSLDGMGVLSEEPLEKGDLLTVRVHLPGYLDPFTVPAQVAWTRGVQAGVCRAGLSIDAEDLELRAVIADYVFRSAGVDAALPAREVATP
jgi:hypothetical protein